MVDTDRAGLEKKRLQFVLSRCALRRCGSSDEKGRRLVAKFGALSCRGIAGPQVNAEFLFQSHAGNRCPQIFLDVVGERAQWGNIDAAHARLQTAGVKFSKKRIKNTEESGEGLSTTGGRGEKDRFAF